MIYFIAWNCNLT